MLWQGLEHALECFALNFNKAAEIICQDINETMCPTIVHKKRVRKGFRATIGWSNQ
jgi:hypothetical protein